MFVCLVQHSMDFCHTLLLVGGLQPHLTKNEKHTFLERTNTTNSTLSGSTGGVGGSWGDTCGCQLHGRNAIPVADWHAPYHGASWSCP